MTRDAIILERKEIESYLKYFETTFIQQSMVNAIKLTEQKAERTLDEMLMKAETTSLNSTDFLILEAWSCMANPTLRTRQEVLEGMFLTTKEKMSRKRLEEINIFLLKRLVSIICELECEKVNEEKQLTKPSKHAALITRFRNKNKLGLAN